MKRVNHLYEKLISDENLIRAIDEVNIGRFIELLHDLRMQWAIDFSETGFFHENETG